MPAASPSAHLDAYRTAGFDVAVICSRTLAHAEARRDEFFPDAEATDDIAARSPATTSRSSTSPRIPAERSPMIEAALEAGKHVLSQKPFVLDLDVGERLADLADAKGVVLGGQPERPLGAAPRLHARGGARRADRRSSSPVNIAIHWDHGWIAGTPFEEIDDLILYDFAIHWFDFLASLIGGRATSVFATTARAAGQRVRPPMLAEALVAFDGGQAALAFDGAARFGAEDRTVRDRFRGNPRQPRAGPREPGGDARHGRRHRPSAARGHLVQGGVPRHDGRASRGGGGRHAAAQRRPRQSRRSGARLCRHRLGPPRRAGGARERSQPCRGARLIFQSVSESC